MGRSAVLLMAVVVAFLAPSDALAKSTRVSPSEWRKGDNAKVLPRYCQDRLDRRGRWLQWREHFGSVYPHMHHYCGGLYAEIKAQVELDKRRRSQWLNIAVGEMSYVARFCDSRCILYADVHKRIASALNMQGRPAEAMQHLKLLDTARPLTPGTRPVPNEMQNSAPQ